MLPREEKNVHTLILLHLAVFLAGWTGIFGRLITLSGLPLVWYRMLVSVVTLFLVLLAMRRFHIPKGKDLTRICACGFILATHWVAFYASIQASNVSVGVACIATTSFFTALLNLFFNRKEALVEGICHQLHIHCRSAANLQPRCALQAGHRPHHNISGHPDYPREKKNLNALYE